MTTEQLIREAEKTLALVKTADAALAKFAKTLDTYADTPLRSMSALSDWADVSPQYLSDLRHGRRTVSAAVLERIVEIKHIKNGDSRAVHTKRSRM